MQRTLYVGLDVHKVSLSVSVAEDGRDGPVRFIGAIPNTPIALSKLAKQLVKDNCRLSSATRRADAVTASIAN